MGAPAQAVRPARAEWSTTLAVVTLAAAPSLASLALVRPIANQFDIQPGLVDYCVGALLQSVGVLFVVMLVLPRVEHQSFRSLVGGWWGRRVGDDATLGNRRNMWIAFAIFALIGLSPVRLWFIDHLWAIVPGPSWSLNSPAANRGDIPFTLGPAIVAFQLLIRIPLTIAVEETLFRGWVQDRHGPIVAGCLFGAFHVGQWWTIPAIVPFGIALCLLRALTSSLRPGAALHYLGDAVYALQLLSL